MFGCGRLKVLVRKIYKREDDLRIVSFRAFGLEEMSIIEECLLHSFVSCNDEEYKRTNGVLFCFF